MNAPSSSSLVRNLLRLSLLTVFLLGAVACSDQPKLKRIEPSAPSSPVRAEVTIVKGINNNSIVTISQDWKSDWAPLLIKDTVGTRRYRYSLLMQKYGAAQHKGQTVPMLSIYEFDCLPRDLHLTSADFAPANYLITLRKNGEMKHLDLTADK